MNKDDHSRRGDNLHISKFVAATLFAIVYANIWVLINQKLVLAGHVAPGSTWLYKTSTRDSVKSIQNS